MADGPRLEHSKPQQQFDIDWFRGIVCMGLVGLHLCMGILHQSFVNTFGDTGTFVIWNLRFGVESFFVLAGFMMAHMLRPVEGESVSLVGYAKRRFIRLILPFWAAIILAAFDDAIINLLVGKGEAVPLGQVAASMLFIQEFVGYPDLVIGYWSMVSLEQFYLLWLGLLGTLMLVFGGRDRRVELIMVWTSVGIVIASAALRIGEFPTLLKLPQYMIYLAVGLLLYPAARFHQHCGAFRIAYAILILTAGLVEQEQSRFVAAIISVLVLGWIAKGGTLPNCRLKRIFAFLGRRSYSLYLIHGIAADRLFSLIRFTPDWLQSAFVFWFVAGLVTSIVASIIFYRWVEQPLQQFARRFDYRTKTALKENVRVVQVKPNVCWPIIGTEAKLYLAETGSV
jgi:peptidoglycan/LPS O-acetylase OafA/YrhL